MADDTIQLSTFFSEKDIVFDQTVPSMYNLVSALVERLAANHFPGVPCGPIVDAVLRRERTSPTAVGEGVALPHTRISGIERPYMALGIYPAGVPAEGVEKPLKLVFLLLVPESQPARYLQILRALAKLLREPGAAERLAASREPSDVMAQLRRSELSLPEYVCGGDLMRQTETAIRAAEPLSEALEHFMADARTELPIIDEAGRLVGTVDTRALLGCFIPKGFRKLFPGFAPVSPDVAMSHLAARLEEAHQIRVCEAMNTDVCTCTPGTPAQEIAADMAERNAAVCYVLDDEQRLIGEIPVGLFFRRILKD